MPIYRMQVAFGADTSFPRDRVVITPHFDDKGALTNPDSLCEDLADKMRLFTGGGREISVKAYEVTDIRSGPPKGEAIRDVGLFPASPMPRELCICLSYYAGTNTARKRGRLYIPALMVGTTATARPTITQRNLVATLVPYFSGLGGADVDWVVYSRRDSIARKVSNYWIDDEWDIQRSRGMRPTTRTEATTSG